MKRPDVLPFIAKMTAYKPPLEGRSAADYLLLDFNERTIPLPEVVIQALQSYVGSNKLHRYPEYGAICDDIAEYAQVAAASIMIANGSDQGIDIVFRAFTQPGDEVIVPVPTFAMHEHCAHLQGCKVNSPLYSMEKGYPFQEVIAAITPKTRLIVVCNPNNPTGTILPPEKIAELARQAPHAIILVDECYFEFSRVTAKDFINEYQNIIITRTFSKTWGLASLRLGYVMAAPEYIEEFLKVRGPYDVNRLAIETLRVAMQHRSYVEEFAKEVMDVSLPLFRLFLEQHSIPYWPTAANFVLFEPKDAALWEAKLREQGIIVRPRKGPNIDDTLRVTIGTKAQTERLIECLSKLLN